MSKINPVSYQKLETIFLKAGFSYRRTSGDHIILTKEGVSQPIVIPIYKEMPVFIIKNLLRAVDIRRDRYFELLK